MILVDASVWIDFFRQEPSSASLQLTKLLQENNALVAVADLVVYEVLRGFRDDQRLRQARALLLDLPVVEIGGLKNALLAAEYYQTLRAKGYTIRSPMDVLLASYCIAHGHMLLHRDSDFDILETLRGLKIWPH